MSTSVKELESKSQVEKSEAIESAVDCLIKMQEETVRQARDAYSTVLMKPRSVMTPEHFAAYPHSPTANRYQKAFQWFFMAKCCLVNYKKPKVENLDDCEYLRSAFHGYARAEMLEQHLYCQFIPPNHTSELIDQYLKIRPDDILVEYFKVVIILHPDPLKYKSENPSDFALQKKMIVAAEKLIHKRLNYEVASETHKCIKMSLYYRLGAIYVTTNQTTRALDSFQKCLDLDKTDIDALYGVAYQYMKQDPVKAIQLYSDFINKAPECDKKYPNALYMLASLYWTHYNNIPEALRYCQLAEEAEKKRLSFLNPVDVPQKKTMKILKSMHMYFKKQ